MADPARLFCQISIAMGTYNGAKFLRQQLESLAGQTLRPMELVVCDDVSGDDTIAILQEFAATAPFPVHIHPNPSRLGFGDNFLGAVRLCRGNFIAFCDQDDIWYPHKLEVSANALVAHEADLCTHDADLCDATGTLIGQHAAGVPAGIYSPLALNPWGAFFGFTCTFRRSLLEMIDPAVRKQDEQDARLLSHDGWVYFLASSLGKTVHLTERLAKYRQHGANLYGSNDLSRLQKLRRLITEYEQYLRKYKRLASTRANIFDQARSSWPNHIANPVTQAHRYWKNIEDLQDQRLRIATDPSPLSRSAKIIALWRKGAYAPVPNGGLGSRALAEDSVAALMPFFVRLPQRSEPPHANRDSGTP